MLLPKTAAGVCRRAGEKNFRAGIAATQRDANEKSVETISLDGKGISETTSTTTGICKEADIMYGEVIFANKITEYTKKDLDWKVKSTDADEKTAVEKNEDKEDLLLHMFDRRGAADHLVSIGSRLAGRLVPA